MSILVFPLIDFLIAFALLASLRFIAGAMANVSSFEELAVKDNFAFGISLAGSCLALIIMLHAAMAGDSPLPSDGTDAERAGLEIGLMCSYGGLGVFLIAFGRWFMDIVIFKQVDIKQEISKGNLASAFLETSNTLSTALICWAAMGWVSESKFSGLAAVLGLFVLLQLLMVVFIRMQLWFFMWRNKGDIEKQINDSEVAKRLNAIGKSSLRQQQYHLSLEQHFNSGNQALAIEYMGKVLGQSIMFGAATNLIKYDSRETEYVVYGIVLVFLFAMGAGFLFHILLFIARKIVLFGINLKEEVDEQSNVGVAAVEASIAIGCGVIVYQLTA
eukprot:CAMPEP_0175140246 /NCGR_PEP_ID=MMETSP0087-20121206/11359_1 /TAXON_ID=136419 /ORGANISM="Unknown Unknown, Strain D1" /LENGTH=329 /DNA_ID=CAMNT_0016423361 /DNA_START=86 /DNA_END=1075 /DNA_ORIENTATION=+